ncbi:MarR family winged helix-turn-helix transcriptional regulator [Paenibacillus oleatilyticus]|uniref:MarR family winged helix-turn-helix transcriptional regulator n=1 Tax=Paenibacillus oleatilyticus TaxID=2594886 RepID=UPI001C1F2A3F|nr:MarR family transcriptional regulator [Paenibacillus oleatilyticus]MBU7318464.1 MarR family transcriptional regulator [Paenibacillus oleatilyticus]
MPANQPPDTSAHEFDSMNRMTETFLKYKMKLIEQKLKEPHWRMNNTKYYILKTIYHNQNCMVADIAKRLQLSSGATTIALNQLEEDGFIVRLRSDADRRTVRISLTEQGAAFVKSAMEIRRQLLADMLEPLSDEEKTQFFAMIDKITEQLALKLERE